MTATEEGVAVDLGPIVKRVTVRSGVEDAFRVFTERIGAWWPFGGHSVFEEDAATCGLEPGVGGRLFERHRDGREVLWGNVLVWEPPSRLVFTWHPGREPDTRQEVEVRFEPGGGGTVVTLEHRGWETLGDMAGEIRAGYTTGWDLVLDRFVDLANDGSAA